MAHYNRESLAKALAETGLKPGSVAFCHSNIGHLGLPEGERSETNMCETVLGAFQDVLGPEGTLIVPTFTYSFSQGKSFDPDSTPSDCGIFTEFIRKHPNACRYADPNISVSAIGRDASVLTENAPENAYGENSFFDRFRHMNGTIANINFDAGSTFIHYVERLLEVPYRFDKTFIGVFARHGIEKARASTIFVRHLVKGTEAAFEPFTSLAAAKGMFRTAKAGRGIVGTISARETYELIRDTLPERPWLLTRADSTDVKPDLETAKNKCGRL
jgi:aminoglycoside 3-N-acetyltransferase